MKNLVELELEKKKKPSPLEYVVRTWTALWHLGSKHTDFILTLILSQFVFILLMGGRS